MMTKHCERCGSRIRVKEPTAIGTAPYDRLLDVAYEQINSRNTPLELRRQAEQRMARVGGVEHFEAMRSQVRL
jgi:hypothetical protein